MPPIRVPRTPASAFDPKRPASALLKSHVKELQRAVFETMTEGEAAKLITSLTRQLHARLPHTAPRRYGAPPPAAATAAPRKARRVTKRKK